MSTRTWSTQQNDIFSFFVGEDGHLIVRARAGTGKTTTIVEAVKRYKDAFPDRLVIICAFNTRIKEELEKRFVGTSGIEVATLHSLGYSQIKKYWEGIRVEPKDRTGERKKALTDAVCGMRVPDVLKRLVTKLHTLARETKPLAQHGADLVDLAVQFECVPDDNWSREGWTVDRIAEYAYQAMVKAAATRPTFIDFADMIYLPCRHGWTYCRADLVVVDEMQDMTEAQLMIALGIGKRLIGVGDDRQGIYSFRGADAGSLDRLKAELLANELGLTVTYRCARAIVEVAAAMVPDFQAGPSNPEGQVLQVSEDKLVEMAQPGDFVLSRTNAPLVTTAMSLLRAGKKAKVAGKQIGKDLQDLVNRLAKSARSVPEFLGRLEAWTDRQIARAKKAKNPEHLIDAILDQQAVLVALTDNAESVAHIVTRIEWLFAEEGTGADEFIICSSVHKAKGLEADRVFILASTLKAGDIEEENIRYVAVTRAKQTLVWVGHEVAA